MDRVTRCAQILWSATRHWAPTTGEEVRLAEARLEVAKLIYKLDGAGFPQPLVPEATQRRSPEWSAVVDAATNALDATGTPHPPLGTHAVLWPADKARAADSLPAQSPALPVAWAYSRDPTSEIVARYGPFIDRAAANQEVVLFVFKSIDMGVALRDGADASPGLYPRRWTDRPMTTKFTPNRTIMVWATVLALLALALAIYAVASVYVAGEFTHGAVKEMLHSVKIEADAIPVKCAADDAQCQELQKMRLNPIKCVVKDGKTLTLQWQPDGVNGTLCDTAWTVAWMKQDPKLSTRKDWWDDVKKWFWRPTSAHQNLSLLWPFIDCVVAIMLLILAAGLIGRGYLGGALINERNRVSLERLQQISWTVVILGGYAVLALFNAALLSSYVREKIQLAAIAEITPVLAGQPVIPTDIPNLFPSMDPTLWAVLGITAVLSPYLSNRILASKSQKDQR